MSTTFRRGAQSKRKREEGITENRQSKSPRLEPWETMKEMIQERKKSPGERPTTSRILLHQRQEFNKEFCGLCGAIHKEGSCEGPHNPICFCPRCRGIEYHKWIQDQFFNHEDQMITVTRNTN